MNPTVPARVHSRNLADRRLQSMTLGAAVLGIAGTGAFGFAAAMTYTGTANAANVQAPQVHFGDDEGNGDDQPLVQQPFNGTGSSQQGANVNPFGGQQVRPPTSTRQKQTHVSTGGS